MQKAYRLLSLTLLLLLCVSASAQRFFNLTAHEVKIDSVLPQFTYSVPLGDRYADSVYSVSVVYPEFIDMSKTDIARYEAISGGAKLPTLPVISQRTVVSRKQGSLEISLCPLVYRDKRYQMMVSFMLKVESKPLKKAARKAMAVNKVAAADRYAAHSVLATGKWAKIRVAETGIYELTDALIRKAGFSNLNKVHIYGYGGALQNETLRASDLVKFDDLQEVATCTVNGHRLFHAQGPVSWKSNTATERTRNPYSQYGYYFLTQNDDEPLAIDSTTFINNYYPSADDYHWLHEVDGYAWYAGGRNLFDEKSIAQGKSAEYQLPTFPSGKATLTVAVTAGVASSVEIALNGTALGTMSITQGEYDKGNRTTRTFAVEADAATANTLAITAASGGPVRLDYISVVFPEAAAAPSLRANSFAVPEYVYNITNQDHHADGACDMVIIIPTSQKLLTQARRLQQFHEEHDGLRVKIVPADELYNEFSSGTPDANAYRRYLKMLYDRAESESDIPRYLLLFGDCVWDNRMLTPETRSLDADDYLLCYESENSFSQLYCYVDDGFFCLLDDGEGANPQTSDKLDMAVGRFPVTTEAEAKIMVDKTINYVKNTNGGAWENTILFMGDDGNDNLHMTQADDVAEDISSRHPGYLIRKVMWDAYRRESSATGNTYPEVSAIVKQQQSNGALVMDYTGHGRADQISHERVLTLSDFQQFRNAHLPLWITASCDIMPFDGVTETIGEAAVLNEKGGALAFFGTTRTVQSYYNERINQAFLRHVLNLQDGKPTTIGEAQRLAKNEMITTGQDLTTNKLQYSLLGDPAVALHLPTFNVVVDSINGQAVATQSVALKVGSVARVAGHIEEAADFNGTITATVRDVVETIECRLNNTTEAEEAFTFNDRTKVLFSGSDSVSHGRFSFSFPVPKDISYKAGTGMMNFHAIAADKSVIAHGAYGNFTLAGAETIDTDSIGPSIYCYLNSRSFTNGGNVNTTPYFVAEISDDDGINAVGNGIGHDLQLIIDGDMSKTYNLNDNFSYDFGSYTSGTTFYNIPELSPGRHHLLFRAWDVLNNSATAELDFNVVRGLEPNLFSVGVDKNPVTNSTTFIINHDRTGSDMDVEIEVFDMSGRLLWHHSETGVPTSGAYTVEWDLTLDSGGNLQTGVYLYRVKIATDGSKKASKAKKLIVLGNK